MPKIINQINNQRINQIINQIINQRSNQIINLIISQIINQRKGHVLYYVHLFSFALLYFPLIHTTLISDQSGVYNWQIQQHEVQQRKTIHDMGKVNQILNQINTLIIN